MTFPEPESNSFSMFQEGSFDPTMFDLFCIELETQCQLLNQGLIEIERNPKGQKDVDFLMRAVHSIKGAARVVNLNLVVRLAHAMEDCFTSAQNQTFEIAAHTLDQLLRGVDFLVSLSKMNVKDIPTWLNSQQSLIESLIQELTSSVKQKKLPSIQQKIVKKLSKSEEISLPTPMEIKLEEEFKTIEKGKETQEAFKHDRILRMTAENLNRLMGLTGESLIESRWLYPFAQNLQNFKNKLIGIQDVVDVLREDLLKEHFKQKVQHDLKDLHDQLNQLCLELNNRAVELDDFIHRNANLSDRLYQEVVNSRMRPFADGVESFPRLVRDLARQLGKQVRLDIEGKSTPVDRDILEKLESPLSHLLRNAVDHGIESPQERSAVGKPIEGSIKLEACHRGGMLAITVADDGRGMDIENLRSKIVERHLSSKEMVNRLTESEVIDFLFLPGFSTSPNLTEISGRGIGLNIVQNMIQDVGGMIRVESLPGKGMNFYLQLPLTLSIIRALLVEISGELYAFSLARIDQVVLLPQKDIQMIENCQFFHHEGRNIGLVSAWQILDLSELKLNLENLTVVVLSERLNHYGLVVDRIIGEKELVVQELDPRLGKVPDISAGALMEDGSPVFIIDIEEMIRSIDHFISGQKLNKIVSLKNKISTSQKRILVVDDSMTVREVECRLLLNHGYQVDTAVNGMDGWNAIRTGHYDLVITDIDMPRMNGIELLKVMRSDPKFHSLPLILVSYKEGEEDRVKGLEAGANHYFTKGSFSDSTLIHAVIELIGDPDE